MQLRPILLLLAFAFSTCAFADDAPAPNPEEQASLQSWAAAHPECLEWNDGCSTCRREMGNHCSTPRYRLPTARNSLQISVTYASDFLSPYDRLVAFDAETTGKRTPDVEFIRKQPFAWRPPGIVIEVGFVELLREGESWRKGEAWRSLVNPDGPIEPAAIKVHGIKPNDLRSAPRFPQLLDRVRNFIAEGPIVAHAYRNERSFLDYEYARAKAIVWGESAYPNDRYICTQLLYSQLYPGAAKSLTAMCDRLVLDTSERDAKHGALLDADMTADALVLLERELKHGRDETPRTWST